MNQSNQRSPAHGATGDKLPVDFRAKTPDATEGSPATVTVLRPGWREKLDDGEFWNRAGLAPVVFGLGTVAFRRLLVLQTDRPLKLELEEFFFVASDTAPAVVVLVSLCLLYFRRERIFALPRRVGAAVVWIPLAVLAALCLAWANFTGAPEFGAPALGLTILSLAVTVRGTAALRVVWLPALYLLFAVPIPAPLLSAIVFQLQLWSAELTGWLLFLLDIPAVVSGDQIFMSSQTYMFIESCSGIRAIMTLSMVTIVVVDLFSRRGWHVAIMLLAAPLVAF